MIQINLRTNPVLRGQMLEGNVCITPTSSYTPREVRVLLIQTEGYPSSSDSGTYSLSESVAHVLFLEKRKEITPFITFIDFEYLIPENAPFTIHNEFLSVTWEIKVSIKTGIIPKKVSKQLVVSPHVLKSVIPPTPNEIPLSERWGNPLRGHSSFSWEFPGEFHMSKYVDISTDKEKYSLGETVSGNLFFCKNVDDADLDIYLVSIFEIEENMTREEGKLMLHMHDTFPKGLQLPFSFEIPVTGYPTFRTKHSKMRWVVRAVISKRFRFTSVREREIEVAPLTF